MIFPLHFHYEDVSRQDPLLKPNHANVMKVPRSLEIRLVPRGFPTSASYPGQYAQEPSDLAACFRIHLGNFAMEIPCGQRFIKTRRGQTFLAGRPSFRSNPFDKERGSVNDFARQSALRGHGMYNFLVRISTVMSLLDSPVEIRENRIHFSMGAEFCESCPELEDSFEIFERLQGFNVTIVTSAKTKDETLPSWSGLALKEE